VGDERVKCIAALFSVLLLPLHEPDEEMGANVMFRQLLREVGAAALGATGALPARRD
jgi:hypothetical protein